MEIYPFKCFIWCFCQYAIVRRTFSLQISAPQSTAIFAHFLPVKSRNGLAYDVTGTCATNASLVHFVKRQTARHTIATLTDFFSFLDFLILIFLTDWIINIGKTAAQLLV